MGRLFGAFFRSLPTAAFFLTLTLLASAASAQTRHALIVAVNDYPVIGPRASLHGPANDAALLVRFLTETPALGFSRDHVTVLANGPVKSDGEPTHDAVLGQMAKLAKDAVPGDFVYIHFAGHGSRQKAIDPTTEPDAKDEIFLPSDTGEPVGGIYPNALIDDEIGTALDAIRAAGAFVFIVFDSCHSSTATRGAGIVQDQISYRWLPDADGTEVAQTHPVTREDMREPAVNFGELKSAQRPGMGGMAAFFAAQTIEPTPELPLPRNGDGAQVYGLFGHTLIDVLAKNPNITYRELAQGIVHEYAVGNFSKPTPMFEGDLDTVVFGLERRPPVLSWPVAVVDGHVSLPAGTLHGIEKGTVLALVPGPLASADDALGYISVRGADAFSAQARAIKYAGTGAPDLTQLQAGTYARVVETPMSFELTVELPSASDPRFAEAVAYARRELEAIAANDKLPLNLRLVEPGENADLTLVVASQAELYPGTDAPDTPRLWFLPPGGQLSADPRYMPHSIGLDGGMTPEQHKQLENNLAAVFRATSLAQLSDLSQLDRSRIKVGLDLHSAGTDKTRAVDRSDAPLMAPDDELVFSIDNETTKAVDVDLLLVGPDYSIKHMMGMRFQRHDKISGALSGITDAGYGLWRLVLVMREARRNSDYNDLSFLSQIGAQTRAASASGPRDFDQLLGDIGTAPPRRGADSSRRSGENALKGSLEIYNIEAVPEG